MYFSGLAIGQSCAYNCCEDDWVGFQGSCYLFGNGIPVHHTEAEHYCNQQGGHLVTIESKPESMFLKDYGSRLIKNTFWIGLTDRLIEGVWKWQSSGELAVFTDWMPGQPDNAHNDDCVHIDYSTKWLWADTVCVANHFPLCEKNSTASTVDIIG